MNETAFVPCADVDRIKFLNVANFLHTSVKCSILVEYFKTNLNCFLFPLTICLTCSSSLLQDVNDERPQFSVPFYKAMVSEAAAIGTVIPLDPPELARDADSELNGQVSDLSHAH